jgi:hypothetical protein
MKVVFDDGSSLWIFGIHLREGQTGPTPGSRQSVLVAASLPAGHVVRSRRTSVINRYGRKRSEKREAESVHLGEKKKEEKYLVHCSLTGTNEHYLVEMTTRLVILGGSASSPACPRRAALLYCFVVNANRKHACLFASLEFLISLRSGTFGLRISRYTSVFVFVLSWIWLRVSWAGSFVMLLGSDRIGMIGRGGHV